MGSAPASGAVAGASPATSTWAKIRTVWFGETRPARALFGTREGAHAPHIQLNRWVRTAGGTPALRLAQKRRVQRAGCLFSFGEINHHGDFDFAGGDHVDVDAV